VFFLILFFWPLLDRNRERDPRKRPIAMTLLGGGTIGLVALTIFAVANDVRMQEPTQAAGQKPRPTETAGPIQRAQVAKLYNTTCAACHGVDGTGKLVRAGLPTIPDFTSAAWQQSQTEIEIAHRIQDGNIPLMPAYRDTFNERQILALAIYVRAFWNVPGETPVTKPIVKPPPDGHKEPPPVAHLSPTRVYVDYCLSCHGADGRGDKTLRKGMPKLPDMTDAKWQKEHKESELITSILEGKKPFMPPMKDKLSRDDAPTMAAFVRKFAGGKQEVKVQQEPIVKPPTQPEIIPEVKKPDKKERPDTSGAETAAQVRAATGLYRQYCLICHGNNGKGSEARASMPRIPDFTSRQWQEGANDPSLAASILEGKGDLMPAARGRVTEAQAKALVAYIRAFGPARTRPKESKAATPDKFEKDFRKLQEEWEELQKRLKELKAKPAKP
jgi:mono/diheme cytochrome c family protein